MTRLALYREERPQTFAEVVGQQHVTRTLKNARAAGRLSHAYLFSGPRGTGKTSIARILAKAINCLAPTSGEPCDHCQPCRLIREGRTMDVIEIDAASNRGIDEIRDLRDKVKYSPTELQKKVYIIDEVHMLTEPAFNALLKTLEEPPDHVVFVLATTEAHKVPITIRSRCQRYDFHRLDMGQTMQRLHDVCIKHGFQVEEDALAALARQAEGGMRDALSLLDQLTAFAEAGQPVTLADTLTVLGAAPLDRFLALDSAIAAGSAGDALLLLDDLVRQGKDLRQFVRDFLTHQRDLLMLKVANGALLELPESILQQLQAQAVRFDQGRLMSMIKLLAALETDMRLSTNPRLLVEVALIRMSDPAAAAPVAAAAPAAAAAPGDWTAAVAPAAGARAAAPRPAAAGRSAATTGARPGSGPEVEAARKAWPEIIALFGSNPKAKPYQVWVQQATPFRVEGRLLVISFPANSEGRTAKDILTRKVKWIEEALKKVGLPEYQVSLELVDEAVPAESPTASGPDLIGLLKQRIGGVPIEVKEDDK